MIKIFAPITPVTFKRPDSNRNLRFDPRNYADFKNTLGFFALKEMRNHQTLKGPIKFSADVYKKIIPTSLQFGDWDNHAKAICDALNGICYSDDSLIIDGRIRLFKGDPHIDIILEELEREIKQ